MNRPRSKNEDTAADSGALRCPSCAGVLMVFASDYVTWDRCFTCGHSEVIGWVSCQAGTLRSSPDPVPAPSWGAR